MAEEAIKAPAAETTYTSAQKPGRLYGKALFMGFRCIQRNQHENITLSSIDGVSTKDTEYYLKRCAYVYKAKRKTACPGQKESSHIRVMWGKVMRPHGNSGAVHAKFRKNLPPNAMGRQICTMLYP